MRQQTTLNAKNQKKPVSRKAVKKSKKAKASPIPNKKKKSLKSEDGGMPNFAPVDPSQRLSPRDQESPVHDHERVH